MKKLKFFELFAVVAIEMSVNTIKISNRDDIDKLRNLLDVGSWNQLIYYNKKSFPVTSIMLDEIDIGIYQDEDTINVSYGGKISHYRVKREIKNELAEFIKVH